jgi:DNA polymerase III alpha subunit
MLTEDKIIQSILKHGTEIINTQVYGSVYDLYMSRIFQENLKYPVPKEKINSNKWYIPKEYEEMDMKEYLMKICPKENFSRLSSEIELWENHNMIPVLKAMKYIVDTLRKNNIVWGVGRGSSVSSYVLFLLGVHKIDSVKYKLPIEEFFKEKNNG